jgi:CBS domain-containing protein
MKIQDLMTTKAITCSPNTNLATAAGLMWDSNCGSLAVMNNEGKVIGLITDRDICIAVATRHRLASEILVSEVTTGEVWACGPQDGIWNLLQTMRHARVRRIPVISDDGVLQGIVSISDVVLRAEETQGKQKPELSLQDAIDTLKEVCRYRGLQQTVEA